ncbi:YHS domain-containing protein [Georgenia yuyongxinii]
MCERHEGHHGHEGHEGHQGHEGHEGHEGHQGHEDNHGGCCGGGAGHAHGHHEVVAGPGDEVVTCAVKGNATVRSRAEADGLVRDYQGERYYLCCGHCADMFDADPAAYTTAA